MKITEQGIEWEHKQLDAQNILEYLVRLHERYGNLKGVPIKVWLSPEIERELLEEHNPINNIDHYVTDDKIHSIDLNIYE